jgi:CRP-like cAMP-binding protein
MHIELHHCRANAILAALAPDELLRLRPHLEHATLRVGQVLCEPGRRMNFVYFPTTALVSLLFSTATGDASDLALTGADGLVGISFFAMPEGAAGKAVVQRAGFALRAPASALLAEFQRGGALQLLALRYNLVLMAQIAQTALCNRHHKVEQQLCRWLLMCLDRSPGPVLEITQQQLAAMLGVRREAVSAAAGKLQALGVLRWSRGRVSVPDRALLERSACGCYCAVRGESHRLLPAIDPTPHPA